MKVDEDIQRFIDMAAAHPAPDFAALTAPEMRAGISGMLASLNEGRPPVAGVQARDIRLEAPANLDARLYRPTDVDNRSPLPCLIFFHGGGWVVGDLDTHDFFCRQLASAAGCAIVAVGYRLAPEHIFPAAVDDAIGAVAAVTASARDLGIDPDSISVGGDSAGGTLAAVAAQHAAAEGVSLAGQLLICPAIDLDPEIAPTSSRALYANGYIVSEEEIRWYASLYLPPSVDRRDARVSPLHGTLSGLAPAIVVTAGFDPLRDEGLAYAAALARAGTQVTAKNFATLVHGFNLIDAVSLEARRAVTWIAATLQAQFTSRKAELATRSLPADR